MNNAMTPPVRQANGAVSEIADAAEDATADAVVWSGEQAVVVGSAGATGPTPTGANPIDLHGKLRWDHDLAELDEVTAVMALGDDVVIAGVAGRTTTSAGTSRLIRIDATGVARWDVALPERGPGELFALAPLGDGGVAVGQAPGAAGRDGAWIVRFDAGGAIRASQVLPAKGSDAARAVAATADGGFVVAGSSFEAPQDRRAIVWRLDGANQLVWRQACGSGAFARGVAGTADGGAIVVGATQPAGSRLRALIVGIDRFGAQRWAAP